MAKNLFAGFSVSICDGENASEKSAAIKLHLTGVRICSLLITKSFLLRVLYIIIVVVTPFAPFS